MAYLIQKELSLRQIEPPADATGKRSEFIEGTLYFGVRENHVILLQSPAFRSGQFEEHINWLLRHKLPREEAFEDLLAQKVYARHEEQIKADPALREEIWSTIVKYASPEELREFAGYFRRANLTDEAYDLEEWADERQMGRFGED